jgi:hypothetical protein
MENKYVTIEEAQKQFPDEWLLLGNPITDNLNVIGGILLYHSKDKKEVCYLGRDKTEGFDKITLEYTGSFKPKRRIGIMRRL